MAHKNLRFSANGLAYDPRRGGWTAVVLDDNGTATIVRASGSATNHVAYRSVYPDASIAVTFDRIFGDGVYAARDGARGR